jgi:hypothetical protein
MPPRRRASTTTKPTTPTTARPPGTRARPADPISQACDTFANNNDHALDVNADLIAFAILTYAYSTESVNGVPGRSVPGNFRIPAPDGSEGTFVD